MKEANLKKFTATLGINSEFFIAHLPILVRCKTKGAAGAVCAIGY